MLRAEDLANRLKDQWKMKRLRGKYKHPFKTFGGGGKGKYSKEKNKKSQRYFPHMNTG